MRRAVLKKLGLLAVLAAARPGQAATLMERIQERRAARAAAAGEGDAGGFALPPGATVERNVPYGNLASQTLDVFRPASASGAPLLLMVHGGGWRRGDKSAEGVVRNKVQHWVGRGWVVVSVNYRVLPEADPLTQADDISRALGYAQKHARGWGADPARFVLMGHSAGAHLVSLLTADPALASRHGGSPWLGTVSLDSAAFDVESIMRGRHYGLYDQAFGRDPVYWRDASPTQRLKGKPVAPMLVVCSTRRADSCPQGSGFAAKAESFGGRVSVLPVDLSHGDANMLVGAAGPLTDQIDAFLRTVGAH